MSIAETHSTFTICPKRSDGSGESGVSENIYLLLILENFLVIILIIIICLLGWFLFKKHQQNIALLEQYKSCDSRLIAAHATISNMQAQLLQKDHEFNTLFERSKSLEKYQHIIDVSSFIKHEKEVHQIEVDQQIQALNIYRNNISHEANQLITEIKREFEDTKVFLNQHKAVTLKRIDSEAKNLLDDYYELANEKLELKKIVKALENKIQGYSDEYLMPNQVLLNDLVDGYDHLDAVNRLKSVRNEIKISIKAGTVAECDYVEDYRRVTAIAFITNAFNGQADAILSRIRHDNVGKLIQEMKDSCLLLNNSGQAFRNARITDKYLSLRLEELKLASIIQEFKLKEREEQREIREIIREEEKARKEYERAMKEAEREELALKKAYEKIKADFDLASDSQKEKYEHELNLLNEKLQLAEEKSQRALSMAQQTRAGHVYVISNVGSFGNDVLKLGMTRRLDPMDRVKELGDASVPFTFDVHAMIYSEDAPTLEKKLHHYFNHQRVNKVNYKKEFFKVNIDNVKKFLEDEGIEAKFTLKAEALQYRESLRIESLPEEEKMLIEDKVERESSEVLLTELTNEDD